MNNYTNPRYNNVNEKFINIRTMESEVIQKPIALHLSHDHQTAKYNVAQPPRLLFMVGDELTCVTKPSYSEFPLP